MQKWIQSDVFKKEDIFKEGQKLVVITHEVDNDGIGSAALLTALSNDVVVYGYDYSMETSKSKEDGKVRKLPRGTVLLQLLESVYDMHPGARFIVTDIDICDLVIEGLKTTLKDMNLIWIDHHTGTKSLDPILVVDLFDNYGKWVIKCASNQSAIMSVWNFITLISKEFAIANMDIIKSSTAINDVIMLSSYDIGNFHEENVLTNDIYNMVRDELKEDYEENMTVDASKRTAFDLRFPNEITYISKRFLTYLIKGRKWSIFGDFTERAEILKEVRSSIVVNTLASDETVTIGVDGKEYQAILIDVNSIKDVENPGKLLSVCAKQILTRLKDNDPLTPIKLVYWVIEDDGKSIFSFRSLGDNLAFRIASANGGGGHPEASGSSSFDVKTI